MARRPVSLEDLDRLGIDPTTSQLFWDGQEIVTKMALPWAVNVAIIAAAVIAGGHLVWNIIKHFLDRNERRREAMRGTESGSASA